MAAGRRTRWLAAGIGLLAITLLAAAFQNVWRPVTARPALWHITQGEHEAWLFGTIHAVPRGARWLSPAIEKAVTASDYLVLEAEGLASERADRRVFETLGRSPGLPPVAERIAPEERPALAALTHGNPAELDGYESWAAALLISASANADAGLSSQDAPEARLEAQFHDRGRPMTGLETIEAQLGAFDTLPEAEQRALLNQALDEADEAEAVLARLYGRWADGDIQALEAQFLEPLADTPLLRDAVIDQRNRRWALKIDAFLRKDRRKAFIAVGAAHLLGNASVQSLLAMRGWRVERVQ